MGPYIIAYDLGTGGNKTSIFDTGGNCLAADFEPYETHYPALGQHEQNPMDWWNAIVKSTKQVITKADIDTNDIECCGISGHSLGVVPLDKDCQLLRKGTPIWSDSRPDTQVPEFLEKINEEQWYTTTGNGFPPALYSVFKIMWYRDNEPEMFKRVYRILGTKDFINFKLTGQLFTDFSYASGTGVYDLLNWKYSDELISASGLSKDIFPEIVPATQVIGSLTPDAAKILGLNESVKVVSGGVDNSCMALGAKAFKEGRVYNSLGSSSWIAVSSAKPLLNIRTRPYVFTHVVPGQFTSAMAIFSAGSSFNWVQHQICRDIIKTAKNTGADPFQLMIDLAKGSPAGANKLIFNPSLGGGSSLDKSSKIRGAYTGLDLGHTQADLIRSAMEGIAMGQRVILDEFRNLTEINDEMIVVGGGSKSKSWRQIYSDIYNMNIVKTNIDQQAAALGAAAVAAVGTGLWSDFEQVDKTHNIEEIVCPDSENNKIYESILPIFRTVSDYQSNIGNQLAKLEI
jgi:xylulokinase